MKEIILDRISSFLDSSSVPNQKSQTKTIIEVKQENELLYQKDQSEFKVVIFTKDRPWQLQQILYSMKLELVEDIMPITINIICYASSIEFHHGYDQVRQEFIIAKKNLILQWFYESSNDKTTNSGDDFSRLLEKATLHHDTNTTAIIMFLTDDCILLQPLHQILSVANAVLWKKNVIAFCSRLHPGITFSQTKNLTNPPPIRHMQFYQCDDKWNTTNAILYPIDEASMEFAYPFDLSGGIYFQRDVIQIMKDICLQNLEGAYSHPNYFEINGNIVMSSSKCCTYGKYLSIPTTPSLIILAINRVQNICRAPVATIDKNEFWTTQTLLSFLDDKKKIDIHEYKRCMYNTSHIGDLWLAQNDQSIISMELNHDCDFYKMSVLIPVHTGPPKAASLAILSIMNECIIDESIMPIQIVIVDDRCDDGSIDAILEEAQMFGISTGLDIQVFDWKCKEESNRSFPINNEKCIHIYLCKCDKPGLGAALNHGLTYCKSEFIARMDADDISCPFRLSHQLSFLKKDLQTNVIGTNMVIFSDRDISSSNSAEYCNGLVVLPQDLTKSYHGIISTSIQPSDAGFVDWTMMFSCVLSHPTVMFRKSFIVNNGGYKEEPCVTEDYELWLRLQKRQANCMKSMPMIGLCHRKHTSRSNNDNRKKQQRNESIQLSYDAMMEYMSPTSKHSIRHVHVLKFPNDVMDVDTLNESIEMLVQLETAFLRQRENRLSPNEISLIRYDCTERIGELATIGIQKFGRDASKCFAWYMWSERDPNRQLEQVTLLLNYI